MKAIRIIALFLLGTVNAALAQAVTTRVSDYSDIKCPQSFCDAFFDDQSVCEFTGTHALVYERDGVCGIEVIDAVVTCTVPCYALFANTDETKRGEAKHAPPEESSSTLQIVFAVLLGALVVGCTAWQCCRRHYSRRTAEHVGKSLANGNFDHPTLPRSAQSIASAYRFMSKVHMATDSIAEDDEETKETLGSAPLSPMAAMAEENMSSALLQKGTRLTIDFVDSEEESGAEEDNSETKNTTRLEI
jgi:hypothetical protein